MAMSNYNIINNMDGLVPTLELEDLYPEDGPLLKDHFLGVEPLLGDQPLCVAFVDPNTQNTTGELQGNKSSNGFYDEFTAPSWLENNVDLNDLDSMANSLYSPVSSVSTAPFIEPPASQNFIPDTFDYSLKNSYQQVQQQPAVPQIQPQLKKTQADPSELEYSDYYSDAFPDSSVQSVYSTTSWASSTEEEYPSKEAILEEIHREAAEIERFSVSPPAFKTTSRKIKNIASNEPKPLKKRPSTKIPKPYIERKKELNRQAATKYREKKRAEKENLHQEREILETRNTELKAEVSAMASEIQYLKKLIKDIEARTKY